MSQERHNATGWSLGESSSSIAPNFASCSEWKTDHGWSSTMTAYPGPSHFCNAQQYGSSEILSLSNIEEDLNSNRIDNNTSFSQGSSSSTIADDINRNHPVFEGPSVNNDDDDDCDCQVMECTPYKSERPGKELISSASTSGTNGYLMDDGDGRPDSSLDGRRFCKRKSLEGYLAQSSGSGSSNYIPLAENSLRDSVPALHSANNISAPIESNRSINMSEQVIPRLGLTMGGAVTETPLGTTASRSAESSHRNFRVRIDGSLQQDYLPSNLFPAVDYFGNVNLSSEQQLPELLPNIPLGLRCVSAADSANTQRHPVVMRVPFLHRRAQASWNSAASSRTGSSSSFSGERNSETIEEPNSRSVSRNILQHPMFIPSTDGRNLNQNPANSNLAGRNISVAGNVPSTYRNSSSLGANTSSPTRVLHRSPQYHRRLSELVRRSLLSSASTGSGGHSGNSGPLRLSSAVSQEIALSGNHEHRQLSSRERHFDGSIGVPYSWRTLAAAREGRSRLVTEIHNVLDLIRRGEGLNFEDVMMLDQSVFFGIPDIHDRHRDMRLDVDNMTYEELLALEERIGNVCTGLSEENILSRLKLRNYICINTEEPEEAEPCCCICREEYNDGDDLGTLECGHDFHTDCIKQWLTHKNVCPVCKTTGLTT